ncbi:N-acetylmuramoyl-L-alanine amidase [Arenimonas terrae]|uniref:N-acetylmuramoyl-L-alanine amidase AmiC n=1 Tax=Arenimonas terrae TaxID=2546226 RepID=A0A5C4RVN3_9GAMM|nr:N-acetylmuramoyl-L-alanine amidase [Arenimonas terrae]TNJ34969.1 AMIN domain-containing protein [Arenimonas terrae]
MRRNPVFVLFASTLLGLVAFGAQAAQLKGVTLVENESGTRAVLELSGPVDYKLFTLANPHRLVLDLPGSSLAGGYKAPSPNGVVAGVRTGKPADNDLRVVLDLGRDVKPRSRLEREGNGARLVLELFTETTAVAGKPAPARTVQDVIGSGERKLIVAIDAGHGGKDPGAIGPSRKYEKDITLAVARELAAQINADPGMQAFLVRDRDVFIPLEQRYMIAREAQADLFISVHADAAHNRAASGASVYVLSLRGASSEAARWLADQENAADLVGGVELDARDKNLAAVLLDLSQNATMRVSDDVATEVLAALKQVGKAHKPQIERANFVVLRSPDVPSMLVETGFISNPGEEARLSDPAYRSRMAAAIVSGVRSYFANQAPPGTWYAARQGQFGGSRQHVVSRGETLSLIAARHGVPMNTIRAANKLQGDTVRIGERLTIPVAATAVASLPE